jgi:transposase-like protein
MPRFYLACNFCGQRRMHLIGKSSEKFGRPATPIHRYYRCPNCGSEWTFNVERSLQTRGVPDDLMKTDE